MSRGFAISLEVANVVLNGAVNRALIRAPSRQHELGKVLMRPWLTALTLGEWGLTKPCNGGNASTSLIDASTDTKSAAFAKGGGGEGVVVNAWVQKI